MNRAVLQVAIGVIVFLLLAAASVLLTNELFKTTPSEHPTVRFSVGGPSPTASHP